MKNWIYAQWITITKKKSILFWFDRYTASTVSRKGVSSCIPTFFFLHPHTLVQRQNYPLKFLKLQNYP